MLYSIDTGKYVSSLPHKRDFDRWKSHISDADYQKKWLTSSMRRLMKKTSILQDGYPAATGLAQSMNPCTMLVGRTKPSLECSSA